MDIYLLFFVISLVVILILIYLFLKQNNSLSDVGIELAILKTKYNLEIKNSEEKFQILQEAKENLSLEFKNLANKIFEDKAKQFSSTSKEQFKLLLEPFREQITNFSTQSKNQFNEELKDRTLLKDELSRLKQMNTQLSQDAINLTNALKGENKTQGNWGEIVLERILEESGLRDGIEYELQVNLKSDEGKRYLPDVVIHMPQGRDIVIDSKVSLVAYERFVSEQNLDAKEDFLKAHVASISKHIKELSSKNYEKLDGVNTLDFVLLFMPIEGAFLLALESDGEFFKRAYDSNILVVSPSTLLVTLRTIEHIWRTQNQQDNAMKIAEEAEAMYEKLVGFVDEMERVGSFIDKTKDSYDIAMNRLKTGRGNVIKRAQNMKKLGLKPKKTLSIESDDE
ncbi:MAG: DNA recombination protein RmuC [Sulfurimonas sp.]|nr:DNA recombination protein RmuC [Sulfurimonas sp.]